MTIKLHSRIAVAAVIAPLAVLAAACGSDDGGNAKDSSADPTTSSSAPTTDATTETPDPTETTDGPADPAGLDYVVGDTWHQADGDAVKLPGKHYDSAVVWDGQLVVTQWDGEVYSDATVIAEDGTVVDTFDTTSAVVVNDAGTTIAWIDTTGEVMTAWEGDQVSMGHVDLAAPGETIAYFAAAVIGGPNCYEVADGCQVFVNSGIGKPRSFDSHGVNDNPVASAIDFNDISADGLVTYVDQIDDDGSCSALVDLRRTSTKPLWKTCDFEANLISPDGSHVIGLPAYYDGLGVSDLAILDAKTGEATGRYGVEGGFSSNWAWSTDNRLVFDSYDGANWHLFAMTADGAITEFADPVKGEAEDSPFTLIRH
ncbi:hypothetical protein F0U44_03035 [Nocardioides humilatus]|uniref:WD40 repeat domain-containing protein n=1 Tax=Nocardioides humilatus TaxID=2607660 RepID=A0A5B1LNF2_9ACTN|nr:hypothetical protein [Nocardioides humilatus]KAA1421300.1 hypothetical protein F0U44_03035 [Nocardioides humilatus]